MVQLKAAQNARQGEFIRISIPYGSIKRHNASLNKSIYMISIPYGSIKRWFSGSSPLLAIRISIPYGSIKSRQRQMNKSVSHISIPYGSIKRRKWKKKNLWKSLFQFLMVQLKEYFIE